MLLIIIIISIFVLYFCFNKKEHFTGEFKIPNIIHFVFGLKKQTEEFLFSYYLSIYSAYILNKPEKINFYYHYSPYGKWWDKLQTIPNLKLIKVDIPEFIGEKKINHVAHKADIIRMNKLYELGGIYLDIDTISVRSYKHLLNNDVVLGYEMNNDIICNAIMMTKPRSKFFKIWLENYESHFETFGWGEASIILPGKLYKKHKNLATVLDEKVFFRPYAFNLEDIFVNKKDIPKELITLHLWESYSLKYLKNIKDWNWGKENSHTMYGKIMNNIK